MNRERMGAWALGVFTLHLAEQVADLAELGQSCHGCHLPFASQDVVGEVFHGTWLATVLLER